MTTDLQPILKRRRTKIVATIGPASQEPAVLESLIRAGVDVFRLNLALGEQDEKREVFQLLRRLSEKCQQPVGVMGDLAGPKLRVGRFPLGHVQLIAGLPVIMTTRSVVGNPALIPSQYTALARDVKPGDRILLDDGSVELRVERVAGTEIPCTVVTGGLLQERKGINLPNVPISAPALTDKDREDALFALDLGVDYLALPFVRRAEDIADLRTLIQEAGKTTPIIAKIEKPQALENIEGILEASDGIMIARGDLGAELAPEKVPIVQQHLVHLARRKNKPVIVATQMLESMVEHPRPTRAEVSDVSTAVFSGTDAVMLLAETATGAYPLKAVQIMDRVARQVESWQWQEGFFGSLTEKETEMVPLPLHRAVARTMAQLSRDLKVRAVVVRSLNGVSAIVVSANRPAAPIVAMTTDAAVCRRLKLLWGVIPQLISAEDFDNPRPCARKLAQDLQLGEKGHYILLLAGFGKNEPTVTVLSL